MTHRELCRAAARWLLSARWCRVAGYEVGGAGDVFDAVGLGAIPDPDRNALLDAERAWAAAEWDRRVAAWVTTRKGRRPSPPNLRAGERLPEKPPRPRIVVIECKRTRSDLLADLREGKMLGYERTGTHCALAATPEALRITFPRMWEPVGVAEALADLADRGLPTTWGVLVVVPRGHHDPTPTLLRLRDDTRIRAATVGEVRLWQDRIARSLAYRAVGDGPLAAEAATAKEDPCPTPS